MKTMKKTYNDSRISRNLSMRQLEDIANEYLEKYYGRFVNGGCSMGWMLFEACSYGKKGEKHIDVIIDYEDKSLTMIEK